MGFLLAAAAAVLIVPFVGSSPPVLRSAVMIVLVLAGRWVGRGRDQWQVLALAAVVVLAMNPFGLFDVGFQLSFAAFVGMLLLLGPLERLLAVLPEAIRSNVAVSLAATAGTAPVALATFGATSLVSPIANLLVVPTLPLVTGVGMAGVFLGFLSGGLGRALDAVASVPMSWTILVARLMSRAPVLTAADLGRAAVAVAAAVAVLPLALAVLGRRAPLPFGFRLPFFQRSVGWTRAHRPRRRRRAVGLAVGVVLGGLLMGVAVYPAFAGAAEKVHIVAGARGWPTGVELRVLDVGQGNAVLLRTPQHHAALFDGGPAGCRLAAQLHALGVDRLDLVVVSHPHADHFAGLLEALDGIEVDAFVDDVDLESSGAAAARAAPAAGAKPGASQTASGGEDQASAGEAAEYLRLRHELAHEGAAYARAATGFSLRLDGATIHFFAPASPTVLVDGPAPWSARGEEPSGDELNGSSLVAFVTVGTVDMLLPGDAEADVLQRYRLPPAEVLVVPHHGSRGGVTSDLLQQLGTRAAFISVGAGNPFGHPAPATLATLREAVGCVLRTDKSGWVSCTVQGEQMTISAEHMPVTDTQRTQATR